MDKKPNITRKQQKMANAILECRSYNRMGGLDDATIADIAHDHDLDFDELKAAWNE